MVALPAIDLSYGTDLSLEFKVERINFGNGYSQRASELNSVRQSWRLIYDAISDAEEKTLREFFRDLKGTGIIDWIPFNQTESLKFTASRYAARPIGAGVCSASVVLTQEFDL